MARYDLFDNASDIWLYLMEVWNRQLSGLSEASVDVAATHIRGYVTGANGTQGQFHGHVGCMLF